VAFVPFQSSPPPEGAVHPALYRLRKRYCSFQSSPPPEGAVHPHPL
jgi:hypothetical protein